MSGLKVFGLIIFNKQDFLRRTGRVVKTEATNHADAMSFFIANFECELVSKTIMTFCFDDNNKSYGYEYIIINEDK